MVKTQSELGNRPENFQGQNVQRQETPCLNCGVEVRSNYCDTCRAELQAQHADNLRGADL